MLGVEVTEDFYGKAEMFLGFLAKSTAVMNLVGPGEIARLWTRHALESVAFVPYLDGKEVIDIGTGAGFPGMMLALCGFNVTMVESRGKRCAFLETAARECGISCKVVNKRIEDAGPFPEGAQFTSRAVKGPAEMVKMIIPAASESFSLITRVSETSQTCPGAVISGILPVPPLDRDGFILQYRHPGK